MKFTLVENLRPLFAANVTASSAITPPAPTITTPSGDGIIDLVRSTTRTRYTYGNFVKFLFYGTDAANETFNARVTGWNKVSDVWMPMPMLTLNCTLGTAVGVSSEEIDSSQFIADTIVASATLTTASEIISPADNTEAWVKLDPSGCEYLQVQLSTGGSAASCNALGGMF